MVLHLQDQTQLADAETAVFISKAEADLAESLQRVRTQQRLDAHDGIDAVFDAFEGEIGVGGCVDHGLAACNRMSSGVGMHGLVCKFQREMRQG